MNETPKVHPAGETCLVVDFGNSISLEINGQVQALRSYLESKSIQGIMEIMPTYRSLAVYFDPVRSDLDRIKSAISEGLASLGESASIGTKEAVIPVCYGGDHGPDLPSVAKHHGITEEEVVARHSGKSCYCYMLGFTPGFSYLGGMDESIATPRLETPRELIPAGSVGIAGKQTGIYPIDSPGGWQLIGRTPLTMYDPSKDPATLLDAGLWVRFRPIDQDEYDEIQEKVKQGSYALEIVEKGEIS
nr:5-oxoprolinase subunit PxpB [uncultured Dethiosulfovibrio sp.]